MHGLSGWGSYDEAYRKMPYWGMRGGDLMACLREKGFDCWAASVSPRGSAWDRACELYAQLSGRRTDYGKAHSEAYRHARFGRDFTGRALGGGWDGGGRLVLLGHSFGGATVRLFAELASHGSAGERDQAYDDMSPLFAGGMGERLHSLVTLASPMNGTTAYDLFGDPSFDPASVRVPWWSRPLAKMMARGTRPEDDGRDPADRADHDMHIDRAMELNRSLPPLPEVFYFSVPCSWTRRREDGTFVPRRGMEPLFVMRSCQMGAYAGRTAGGLAIGEDWRENDGLVNTLSAAAPLGAPSKPLDRERMEKGIWQVFPTFQGDHMALQGGLMRRHDIRGFYLDLLTLLEGLGD